MFDRIRSLHDQLKEMGVNMDDKALAMTLLESLPEDYKPLIIALEAVRINELPHKKVEKELLNEMRGCIFVSS